MSIEYLKLFFVLVDPEGRIFEMQMGDTWDPVQKREGGWSLGQLLDEDGSVYTRSEWPGGAIAVIQPGKLSDNLLFAKGGLGKHPGHDGWREIVVQAHTFFEAANTPSNGALAQENKSMKVIWHYYCNDVLGGITIHKPGCPLIPEEGTTDELETTSPEAEKAQWMEFHTNDGVEVEDDDVRICSCLKENSEKAL